MLKNITGITDDFETVGIKAIDEHTLKINLKNPIFFSWFIKPLCTWPVHKEILKHGTIDDRNGQWTRPGNLYVTDHFN